MELCGAEKIGIPFRGVARNQRQRTAQAVAADQNARTAGPLRVRQQLRILEVEVAAVESDRFRRLEQTRNALHPLLEASEAPVHIQEVKAEKLMLTLLPASSQAESEAACREIIDGGSHASREGRMAERERGDEGAEFDASGMGG